MPSNIELNVDSEIKDEDRKDASPSGWDIDEDMEMDTKKQSRNNESDSDDEFFEAVEEQNNETKTLQNDDGRNSASTEGSGWATPSGSILDKTEAYKDQTNMREAVAKETDMKLLETGETLCIPITQVSFFCCDVSLQRPMMYSVILSPGKMYSIAGCLPPICYQFTIKVNLTAACFT